MENEFPKGLCIVIKISEKVTLDFTQEVIDDSEYIGKTPAQGDAYYNEMLEFSFIVYWHKIKVSHTRKFKGKTSSCFKHRDEYSLRGY